MFFGVLNRLFGRTDQHIDAVNAYVEGNASTDEIRIVEELMRENSALEKDLATQQSLRSVLQRVEKVEAPRSFAITPEMVAAAERSESSLTRFTELFAPQRKLALAPAVIAGIAALSVALLTLGDVTGAVNQSRSGADGSFTSAAIAESAAGASDAGGAMATVVVETKNDTVRSAATAAPAATSAPAAAMADVSGSSADNDAADAPVAAAGGAAPDPNSSNAELSTLDTEPPSLAAEAPVAEPSDGSSDDIADMNELAVAEDEFASSQELAKAIEPYEASEDNDAEISTDTSATLENPEEQTLGQETSPVISSDDDGLSLPLWQLQVALAAIALAAIGAWAGLRRAHRN